MAIIIFLAFSLLLHRSLGKLVCDDLPVSMCAFSVASSGKRCSLETGDQLGVLKCTTSEVIVHSFREHIETDECINACGVDRNVIGISSDSLLEPQFIARICSKECLRSCPNIVDLYSNLALAEGVYLPGMCKARHGQVRKELSQIKSSGGVKTSLVSSAAAISGQVADAVSDQITAPGPISAPGPVSAAASPISNEAAAGPVSSTVDSAANAPFPFLVATAWLS